ncbi:MAG: ACT domain-containing protein [Spirochaetaceae bacterium]|nr:MAG: ACT domain-containing protein [Spirochaetaceae bacterium]
MKIRQIAIFLENKKGRLADVTRVLSEASVNIRALSLADTADFGILRLIVNDTDKALEALKKAAFVAQVNEVMAVEVDDRPGGLARILEVFDKNNINIEYMYAFVEKRVENAIVIFKIDDHDRAVEVMKKNNISVVTNDILKNL